MNEGSKAEHTKFIYPTGESARSGNLAGTDCPICRSIGTFRGVATMERRLCRMSGKFIVIPALGLSDLLKCSIYHETNVR